MLLNVVSPLVSSREFAVKGLHGADVPIGLLDFIWACLWRDAECLVQTRFFNHVVCVVLVKVRELG